MQMNNRREAREWALKSLYAQELSGNSLEMVLSQILPEDSSGKYRDFTLDLVRRTTEQRDRIDELIREHVEKWEMDRIAVLDRLILRQSICEILFFPDIPPKVTINEAIEIAKKYSTEKSDKFINGVLDAVLHRQVTRDLPDVPTDH
jgi:transcription antitermination protein NusB